MTILGIVLFFSGLVAVITPFIIVLLICIKNSEVTRFYRATIIDSGVALV